MPKVAPYFLYMLDFKQEEERKQGRTLNMGEVSQMASDSWNAMSDDDKQYYKDKAKKGDAKLPARNANASRESVSLRTSQGVSVALIEEEERSKRMELENMRRRVASMVQQLPLMTDFLTYPLYFMCGNYFYKHNGVYHPAEIGMVKFTFKDGVLRTHHQFIAQDECELGLAYTAKAHSEDTHRLPPPPNAFGEKNYGRVHYFIQKFFKEERVPTFDGGKPIIFTYSDPYDNDGNQVEIISDFMRQFAGSNGSQFDVYPMTRLFYVLRKELAARGVCDDIPNESFVNVFLSRDRYEYLAGISCQYHEEKDATRHCALGRARRLTFFLADFFCEHLGVQLVEKRHLPKGIDLSNSRMSLNSSTCGSKQSINETSEDSDSSIVPKNIRIATTSVQLDNQSVNTSSTATKRSVARPSRSSMLAQNSISEAVAPCSSFYKKE